MTAVHVSDLRKEFSAATGAASGCADGVSRRSVTSRSHRARRVRRDSRPERVGEVDAGPPARDPAPPRRRERRGVRARVVREASGVRRLVNRVSVEASFFKRMSSAENLAYAARFYGMTARRDERPRIPEILGRVGFPAERRGEPMENLSRGMQQKVALARALLTSPVLSCSWTSRPRARSALEARGAEVHPRGAG